MFLAADYIWMQGVNSMVTLNTLIVVLNYQQNLKLSLKAL